MAAYVLDIGELVCIKLGQDVDVGRVEGVRGGKVIIRTIGDEEISCVPDDLIDNSFEEDEDEDQDDIVEDLRMEDEEEEAVAWEAWSEDLASSALPPPRKSGDRYETARSLVHSYLQTRDADSTLSQLTSFVEQKFDHCLSLLLRMISAVPEPPSIEYLVLFHLLMLLLSTKISPDHRARYSHYFCKVYDENRAFYSSNGLGELEL